jgi:hypothetical protein
MSEKELGTAD